MTVKRSIQGGANGSKTTYFENYGGYENTFFYKSCRKSNEASDASKFKSLTQAARALGTQLTFF